MDTDKNYKNKILDLNELYLDSNDLDITCLARVYRKSKELGLSKVLEDKLNTQSFSNNSNQSFSSFNTDIQTPSTYTDRNYSEPNRKKEGFDLKQYELKIRQLVYLEKSWEDIKLYAWPIFRYEKTDKRAADLIEYSFLYGSIQDVLEVIDLLELEFASHNYYGYIHEAIRTQLLLVLWKNNLDPAIKNLITESLDIEKLYKLSCYLKEEDSSMLFSYFVDNKESILQALDKYSNYLNIKKGFILCKIAKIAISLKEYQKAEEILRNVDSSDSDYIEAIQILINMSLVSQNPEDEKYLTPILKEPRWTVRLELIEKLLSSLNKTNQELGFNQFLTSKTLTIFFTNPYKYIPNNFQSNLALIELISKYFDTNNKVLSLFNVLKILTSDFNNITTAKSIWNFIEKNWNNSNIGLKRYWYAVSYIHLFYLKLRQNDSLFYKAKTDLENTTLNFSTPYSWNELHTFMCSSISNLEIDEKHKNKMQKILRLVSNNFSYINYKDISNYLDSLSDLPQDILSSFQTIFQKNNDYNAELKLIKYRLNLYGITTEDLKRMWTISSHLDKKDLAWRVASILKYKNELNTEIEKIWRLSGENRANYPIVQLDSKDIEQIILSFNKDDSNFLKSFMDLGKNINDLFLILDQDLLKKRIEYKGKNKDLSRFKDIFVNLKNIDNKYYLDFKNNKDNDTTKDTEYNNSSDNEFYTVSSLYNIISKRLFSFILEKDFNLRIKKINSILPKLANDLTLEKESKQLFNWLRRLSPSQRLSWTQFSNTLKSRQLDEIQTLIISFIYKMIISIYPNHLAILNYLDTTYKNHNNNLYKTISNECIRWILSDRYFSLREKYTLSSRTPISKTLKNL